MGTLMEIFKKAKELLAEERIPARCSVTKESFDIFLGHEKGKLTMLRGERSYSVDVAEIRKLLFNNMVFMLVFALLDYFLV